MIPGIDVSHWQNDKSTPQKMDFSKSLAAGAKFAFIKVSERGGMDEDFFINWKSAKAAGIPRGGYHFLRWDISGLLQARIFCELLERRSRRAAACSRLRGAHQGRKISLKCLLAQFLEAVETILGKKPMIYTSPGFWNSYGKNKNTGRFDASWSYYPLWIAHYTGAAAPQEIEPWKSSKVPWTFWQYTPVGDGLKYGAESKGIDLNWFNGTQEQLDTLTGKNTPTGGGEEDPPAEENPTGGGNSDNSYLQKEIELVGSRIKNIENSL